MTTEPVTQNDELAAAGGTSGRRGTIALALGSCAIGISELAAIGVLSLVADDLGISVAAAGSLVTLYALGVCLGGPLLAIATRRWDRRRVLMLALVVFVVCNGAIAVAPVLPVIVGLRLVSGSLHGIYVGLATSHAAALAAPGRRGGAIALVFGGIAVATVLGAPLGRVLGEAAGWRATFWAVAGATAVALLAVALLVPSVKAGVDDGPAGTLRSALTPRVTVMLSLIVLVMGGMFTFYTYVTEFLAERSGMIGPAVSGVLLAFGVASAVGTMVGGRLADRWPTGTMIASAGIVVIALGSVGLLGSYPAWTLLGLVLCGLAAFSYLPAFQLRLIGLAAPATDLAATLGASAANAGIAIGAVVGGLALSDGTDTLIVVACAICAGGFVATVATRAVRR